ncbi:MAG: PadR family transcriptional regulator [Candidatus Hecatellales archaeon ex4484_218]|nr:MAG: PadR family transcriptional regulator [Candidatus Hecatellales archaeon ex4484_218]
MAKVYSTVPRGFSRFYILHLLKEKPMTGKEIIDEAVKRSGGAWKPSPGLVYPLLGRLLSENLIEEVAEGKFKITSKGEETLTQYVKIQEQIDKQLEVLRKLGFNALTTGKILVEETLDKIVGLTKFFHENLKKFSLETQEKLLTKYKEFLEKELEKIKEKEKQETAKNF